MLTYFDLSMPREGCGSPVCAVARPPLVAYLLSMTAAQRNAEPAPSVASAHDKILIVDFGSQVTQLIARRVREEGVYSEIVPFQKAEAAFQEMKPKASLRDGPQDQARNLEILRCATAHWSSTLRIAWE